MQELKERVRQSEQDRNTLVTTVAGFQGRLDASGATAARAKRHVDEANIRQDAASKFRTIMTIHSEDPATDTEIGRYRYASDRFEQAAIAASLSAKWIEDNARDRPGAAATLEVLEKGRKACEDGGTGMLTGAQSIVLAPKYGHDFCSRTASAAITTQVTGFDRWNALPPALSEAFATKDKEMEVNRRAVEAARAQGVAKREAATSAGWGGVSGGEQQSTVPASVLCFVCGKGGHLARNCRSVFRPATLPAAPPTPGVAANPLVMAAAAAAAAAQAIPPQMRPPGQG